MFRKFTPKDNIGGRSIVKSSVQRGVKSSLIAQFPQLEGTLTRLLNKKNPLVLAKAHEKEDDHNDITLVVIAGEIWFFQILNGPYFPTLRILHRYPDILPHWQVDKGAIKFMFGGAHVMCRGLTSAGGKMVPLPAGSPVAIMAEGKTHALAVGITKMSDAEVRSKNSDIAVENLHQLLDGLFKTERLEG